ncbi:hypothetical protein [Streptomyces stelliscabiei]
MSGQSGADGTYSTLRPAARCAATMAWCSAWAASMSGWTAVSM